MKIFLLIFICVMVLPSCSTVDPSLVDSGFTIQTLSIEFNAPNKFSAVVDFKNDLGREVNINNTGCFFPNFVLEQSVNGQWNTFGMPMCPAIAVPPTKLSNHSRFVKTVRMLTDSIPQGMFRLKFDIREQDITKQIPQEYLFSNTFSL